MERNKKNSYLAVTEILMHTNNAYARRDVKKKKNE